MSDPRPVPCVGGFVYCDEKPGYFPIVHRSDKVRSAKNCWSLPTGLHEIGILKEVQFATELKEELNLTVDIDTVTLLDVYENFIDNWHWYMTLFYSKTKTFNTMRNMEPHKHDEVRLVTLEEALELFPADSAMMKTARKIKTTLDLIPYVSTLSRGKKLTSQSLMEQTPANS